MQYALKLVGQSQILSLMMDQRGRVASSDGRWLVERFGFTDKILAFLLEDKFFDGFADVLWFEHYRFQRMVNPRLGHP